MENFICNLRHMISAKKYAKDNEQARNEYHWYRYLVIYDIESFFERLMFWKRNNNNILF